MLLDVSLSDGCSVSLDVDESCSTLPALKAAVARAFSPVISDAADFDILYDDAATAAACSSSDDDDGDDSDCCSTDDDAEHAGDADATPAYRHPRPHPHLLCDPRALCDGAHVALRASARALARQHLCAVRGLPVAPTTLLAAVAADNAPLVRLCLAAGIDPNACPSAGGAAEPVLTAAARRGAAPVVAALARAGARVDERSPSSGGTALTRAAAEGHVAAAAALLDAGASIDLPNGATGSTPVAVATALGHLSVVELLMRRGADLHVANTFGHTPARFLVAAAERQEGAGVGDLLCRILRTQCAVAAAASASASQPREKAVEEKKVADAVEGGGKGSPAVGALSAVVVASAAAAAAAAVVVVVVGSLFATRR